MKMRILHYFRSMRSLLGQITVALQNARRFTKSKQAEETLRTHSQVLQAMAEGVNFVDPQDTIRFTNRAYEQMFGYEPGELIGQPVSRLNALPPEENSRLSAKIRTTLQSGQMWQGEFINRKKDGTIFYTHARINTLQRGDEVWSIAVQEDITERKRAEAALRSTQAELHRVLTSISDYLWSAEMDSSGQVTYRYYSPMVEKITGYPPEFFMADPTRWLSTIYPDDQPRLFEAFNQLIRRNLTRAEEEFRIIRPDGTVRWVRDSVMATPLTDDKIQLNGVVSDITERKQIEDQLRDSEVRYRAIVEDSPDLICRFLPDTTLTFVNETYCDYFGKTRDELIGMQFLQLIPAEAHQAILEKIVFIAETKQSFAYEHEVIAPNGELRWQSWTDRAIINDSGQVLELQSIGRDITERKQIEEQIKASLGEKEILLKEIHHRVKNNMQIISSLLDLQADSIQDEPVRDLFKDSQQRIKSMALIHEQLYQSNDLARIDFVDYVESLTNNLYRSYKTKVSNVSLHLDIVPLFLSIEMAIPCGLIINELVSNAFKHAFPNGKSGEIQVGLQSLADGQLALSIRDNGIGLPSSVDLSQTQSLGLTLVATLIRQLKGTFDIQHRDGAKFEIVFTDPTVEIN